MSATNAQINTQAIVGNAAAAQATIVPSIENLGGDQLINVTNTLSVPRIGVNYVSNNQSISYQYIYPQTLSATNITFIFTTPNSFRLSDIVLQIPATITVSSITNPPVALLNVATDDFKSEVLDNATWPAYCFLSWIQNLATRIGTNSVQVGQFPMLAQNSGSPMNLTAYYNSKYFGGSEELSKKITIGYPSRCAADPGLAKQNLEAYNEYCEYLKEIYTTLCLTVTTGTALPTSITSDIPIQIPLKLIHSFFSNDALLPPNIPLRLEFTIDSSNQPIFDSPTIQMLYTINTAPTQTQMVLGWINYTQDAAAQKEFNENHIASPIVLRNNLFEYYDFKPPISKVFTEQIVINSQFPRQLIFTVHNISGQIQTITCQAPNSGIIVTNYNNSQCGGIIISDLLISIGGKNSIKFTNVSQPLLGSCGRLLDLPNFITSENLIYTERSGYENFLQRTNPSSLGEPFFFVVNLDPTFQQTYTYRSLDPGSSVISAQFSCTDINGNALGSNYVIRVYKLYDEAVTISADQKVSLIRWPAVPIGGGNTAIASTWNQQG